MAGKRQVWGMRAGMGLAVLLLVGVGAQSVVEARREKEALQWVTHTHQVLESIEALLNGLGSAESSMRGYLLSKDPTLLADLVPAVDVTRDAMAGVVELVVDNPEQQRRAEALRPLVEERLALIEQQVAALRRGEAVGFSVEGRALTERIRRAAGELSRVERVLLIDRNLESERRTSSALWTSPLATLLALVLLAAVFWLLTNEMKSRRKSEGAAQLRVDEMAQLAHLNELLASCRRVDEAGAVVARLGVVVFGGLGGAVALFRPSRDLLEQHARWGDGPAAELYAPDDCWALRRGRPHLSTRGDVCCAHLGADFASQALCVPLLAHGEVIGALQLRGYIDDDAQRVAAVAGESVALAVANLQLRETLRNQSVRDPLTGLFNRRYTEETFARELGRATREKKPLSLLMLDVDHFKRFNDSFGHDAGDHVLRQLATVLQQQTRGSDIAARLGGEELCVLLPNASAEDAARRAEEIRKAVAALELRHHGAALGKLTTSIGVATAPDHADTVDALVRVADAALYDAKRGGRDRVVVAPATTAATASAATATTATAPPKS